MRSRRPRHPGCGVPSGAARPVSLGQGRRDEHRARSLRLPRVSTGPTSTTPTSPTSTSSWIDGAERGRRPWLRSGPASLPAGGHRRHDHLDGHPSRLGQALPRDTPPPSRPAPGRRDPAHPDAVESLAGDPFVTARSDWGIDTVITHATSLLGTGIYEHNARDGKRHALYGSLTEIRDMVLECLDAVASLRDRPAPPPGAPVRLGPPRARARRPEADRRLRPGGDPRCHRRTPWTGGGRAILASLGIGWRRDPYRRGPAGDSCSTRCSTAST